jgi:hypothetical protein
MLPRMGKDDRRRDEENKLGAAALGLEQELKRFEELAASLARAPLTSQKGIEQAARATRDASASQERFAEHLKELVEAVTAARDRQAAAAASINVRVAEIDAQAANFVSLRDRFAALGVRAAEVNTVVQRAAALKQRATGEGEATDVSELRGAVDQALAGLGAVADDAQ